MHDSPIPLVVLGGSDRRAARLPAAGRDKHPLRGFKGIELTVGGRAVIEILLERFRACGAFDPVYVAGPVAVYRRAGVSAPLIDTDSSFGGNIEASVRVVAGRHPGAPIGFTTCDILPDPETIAQAAVDYRRRAPTDLWYPLVRAPGDRSRLGASAWKPVYRLLPAEGKPTVEILPGHIVIADTAALRLPFVFRLFELGYRTRNRSILYRLTVMTGGLVASILYHDLLRIVGGRRPTLARDILGYGIRGSLRLRRGELTVAGLEDVIRQMFVKRDHRERYPERRVSFPILEGLSLALDIDTEEEAREQEPSGPSRHLA